MGVALVLLLLDVCCLGWATSSTGKLYLSEYVAVIASCTAVMMLVVSTLSPKIGLMASLIGVLMRDRILSTAKDLYHKYDHCFLDNVIEPSYASSQFGHQDHDRSENDDEDDSLSSSSQYTACLDSEIQFVLVMQELLRQQRIGIV